MTTDLVATERAALVTSWLMAGERLTVQTVAARLSITERGARYLLVKIAGALEACTEEGGFWRICKESE